MNVYTDPKLLDVAGAQLAPDLDRILAAWGRSIQIASTSLDQNPSLQAEATMAWTDPAADSGPTTTPAQPDTAPLSSTTYELDQPATQPAEEYLSQAGQPPQETESTSLVQAAEADGDPFQAESLDPNLGPDLDPDLNP